MAHFQTLLALPPRSFTYVGIGSCPHTTILSELNDVWDQLVPVFVRETLTPVRCIHFDPAFDYRIDFVKEYFAARHPGLVYSPPNESRPYHTWTSPLLEVLAVSQSFTHVDTFNHGPDDDWFLEELSEKVLATSKLVVQDFSGQYLTDTFKAAYKKTSSPDAFKKNILFDITYGEASCSTDMSTTRPLYDKKGDFINFTFFSPEEMLSIWGYNPALDRITKNYFIKKFKAALDEHHGNYRRRVLGSTCLYKKDEYDDTSDPSLVMEVLQKELYKLFEIFTTMCIIKEEARAELDLLLKNYKTIDMYHWNNCVRKLI